MSNSYANRNTEIQARFAADFAEANQRSEDAFLKQVSLNGNLNNFSQNAWDGWKNQMIQTGKGRFHTVHDANDHLNLILRGSDSKFWQSSVFKNEMWQDWFSPINLSHGQLSNIAEDFFVERFGKDGQVVLFVRGIDGHLWDFWSNPETIRSQPWNFNRLPMRTDADFFAIERAYGGLEAFAIGLDNSVWHSWTMDYSHDEWSQWESLKGCAARELFLANNSEKYPELLVCDPSGQLWTIRHHKDGWHNWTCLGNNILSDAMSVQNSTGGMTVYAVGYDRKLYRISRDALNADWNEWECLGGVFNQLAGVVRTKEGAEVVGMIGVNHQLWILNADGEMVSMGGVLQDARIDNSGSAIIAVGCGFDGTLYSRNL